ncbi:MAG: MMPL family transporter [Clostridiales Family XIII bacterium]|nr:MMPL family transporter [Clostridiales Family XIII bacterium]
MNRLSEPILKHKYLAASIFIAAAAVCAVLWLGVGVNYNMADYLPEDAPSTIAIEVMEKEFTQAVPNARVMVRDVTIPEALAYKEALRAIDGVSDVTWLDDAVDVKIPLKVQDEKIVETYYKDGNAAISLAARKGDETRIFDEIYEVVGANGAIAGDAVNTYTAQKSAFSETLRAMMIILPLILALLVVSTLSWAEPILFLAAIGVAIVINMGTNRIFGEISFITNCVSPILQLAVSLDYAIFLLHSFADFRAETDDARTAMKRAMKRSFPAILASALTTLFGFSALCFMDFRIGFDMGLNLVKGIALSFLCVTIFLPALTLCCLKWIDKTRHRTILPEFSRVGKAAVKIGIPAFILVVLIAVPSFLAQRDNDFLYGMGNLGEGTRTGEDQAAIEQAFGKQTPIVLLVPRGEVAKELALSEALAALPHVTGVISYAKTVGTAIPPEYLSGDITSPFYSQRYARIIAYASTSEEGTEAFALVESVRDTAALYYDTYYSCGESVNLFDMKNVVTKDNRLVNMLAVIAIGAVLLLTFRSVSLPLLLLLTIEASIWINMAIPYFSGTPLSYIGYLVISTVQLGATVDYAILFTDNYRNNRRLLPVREALKMTHGQTFRSILISAAILSLAGFTLWLTSTNPVVQALGLLMGRGALLSLALVSFFLPALLLIFDKVVGATTLSARFYKKGIEKP